MEIKEISESIHDNALKKGFWPDNDIFKKMIDLGFDTDELNKVRSAFKTQKLLLMVSELTEAMEADRKHKYAIPTDVNDALYLLERITDQTSATPVEIRREQFVAHFQHHIKDTHEDEIADAAIRIFDYCRKHKIDLEAHIKLKTAYNETRDYLHGKKY